MDWETQITAICKKYEIPIKIYNDNLEVRDMVAKALGFPSYESFELFPNPKAVIDGRGNPLRPEHLPLQAKLGVACVNAIKREFDLYVDDDEKHKQTNYLLVYMLDNFTLEAQLATLKHLLDTIEVKIVELNSWSDFEHLDILEKI